MTTSQRLIEALDAEREATTMEEIEAEQREFFPPIWEALFLVGVIAAFCIF